MLIATLLLSLATWAAISWRLASDTVNHVGVEPLLAAVPLVLPLLVTFQATYRARRPLRLVVTAYVLLSLGALVALERANVLVQYERWLRRGMPERPCGELARNFWACCNEERGRAWCSQPGGRVP